MPTDALSALQYAAALVDERTPVNYTPLRERIGRIFHSAEFVVGSVATFAALIGAVVIYAYFQATNVPW